MLPENLVWLKQNDPGCQGIADQDNELHHTTIQPPVMCHISITSYLVAKMVSDRNDRVIVSWVISSYLGDNFQPP